VYTKKNDCMKVNQKLALLYENDYFQDRVGNNLKRHKSFDAEKRFIERFTSLDGTVLDVGCSTGEFLQHIGWSGKKYGIEISQFAAEKAIQNGIDIVSDYDIPNSLDAIIYRGTIQHLDSPFRSIEKAAKTLKPGGKVFFIATPNIHSVYYRLFNTLPALDQQRNFYLPSACSLKNLGEMFNFDFVAVEYPYIHSPYSSPGVDHIKFLYKFLLLPFGDLSEKVEFSFHKNMMNMVVKK